MPSKSIFMTILLKYSILSSIKSSISFQIIPTNYIENKLSILFHQSFRQTVLKA